MPKKKVRTSGKPRKDRQSDKRSGLIRQSLRLEVPEARLIRRAAGAVRPKQSIHYWMVTVLTTAAKYQLGILNDNPSPKES